MSRREEIRALRTAADGGDVDAFYTLGLAYYDGDGVPQNRRSALRWFLRAAEAGDADAMYAVGLEYLEADEHEAEPGEAIPWLERAIEQGHGLAYWRYAKALAYGEGIDQDLYDFLEQSLHREPDDRLDSLDELSAWAGPLDRGLVQPAGHR